VKVLLAGGSGQLGQAFRPWAEARGWTVWAPSRGELDITRPEDVERTVQQLRPQVILNAAAYTAVDRAEEEPELAMATNGQAVAHLARAANACGAVLVQISTDYVFDGSATSPYREEDPPRPLSVYGKSKLLGEQAAREAREHLIVRTSWLFGKGWNFVEAIRRQLLAGVKELRVVADQVGRPTYAVDLAGALGELLLRGCRGVFHVANAGATTWAGFAAAIVSNLGLNVPVVPITTAEAARPAPRPAYSVLDTSRFETTVGPLPPWEDALARYLRSAPSAPRP